MEKMLRFGSRRQLHTIISREIIKPSSPTPSHLHTYNLSPLDLHAPRTYMPFIFFYPNNNRNNCSLTADDKARELKNSLSQTLTQYYPFAGRLNSPYNIDCNDEGVVFVEAENDSQLDKFEYYMNEQDPIVNQLFADGMVWENQNHPHSHMTAVMGVQLNRFACGGIGLAVSVSHIIGDGCTVGSCMTHWASVARYGSTHQKEVLPLNPHFIQSPPAINSLPLESSESNQGCVDYVRKFVFPNSKLNELKNKVEINNPTRVEILASLIYKTVMAGAANTKSRSFKPSFLIIPVDLRKKFVPKLPETTVGNLISFMLVTTRQESEMSLSKVVFEIKKEKMELKRVQSMKQAVEHVESFMSRLGNEDLENVTNRSIFCSSLCGFPYNKVDFGWGKPTGATIILGPFKRKGFVLMDTPDGNGIQARLALEKQDMEMFENDKELLSFCQV